MKTYKLIAYQNVGQHHIIVGSTALIDSIPTVKILLICFISVTFSLTQQSTTEESTNHQYFKVKPTDIQVIEGDVAELQCELQKGDVNFGPVQWAKDGFLLAFANFWSNTWRGFRRDFNSVVPYAGPPLLTAYLVYVWGMKENARLKRKDPKDYENDQ